MAEAQILTPVPNSMDDGAANRLPVLGGRLAPFTQFIRQPAVQRALPAIAMTSAIGIAALAYFTMQAAPQAQLFAGLDDADKAAVADALQSQGIDTQLIVYPNQNHGLTLPSYQKDRLERYLAWYAKYLRPVQP